MPFAPESMDFFRRLLNTPSPSGFEEAARAVWRDEVRGFSDAMVTDVHGSEIATIRGKAQEPSFLLMGHIDEIGLIVKYIDDKGYLYFTQIGGIDAATLISQPVRLLGPNGIVQGIIGKVAVHLMTDEDKKKKQEMHELWIDIGARSREEAAEHAPVGTPAVVGGDVLELRNGRFAARCFDNKMGAFVAAEVLRRLWPERAKLHATVHAAATVQEETGIWGAETVAYRLTPTAAIAIDVGHATDIPGVDKRKHGDTLMGKGPLLYVGVRTSNKLTAAIQAAAKSAGIELQIRAESGKFSTDADPMGAVKTGIPAASIAQPLRYMHTSVEMAEMGDIKGVVDVLCAFLMGVQGAVDYTP